MEIYVRRVGQKPQPEKRERAYVRPFPAKIVSMELSIMLGHRGLGHRFASMYLWLQRNSSKRIHDGERTFIVLCCAS